MFGSVRPVSITIMVPASRAWSGSCSTFRRPESGLDLGLEQTRPSTCAWWSRPCRGRYQRMWRPTSSRPTRSWAPQVALGQDPWRPGPPVGPDGCHPAPTSCERVEQENQIAGLIGVAHGHPGFAPSGRHPPVVGPVRCRRAGTVGPRRSRSRRRGGATGGHRPSARSRRGRHDRAPVALGRGWIRMANRGAMDLSTTRTGRTRH